MEYLKILVVVLHVASAAMLFGAPLGLVRMARSALKSGEVPFKLAAVEAGRRGKMAGMGSMATLLTGLILIFLGGGFGVVTKNFHVALLLMLVAFGFSFGWMRPNGAKLVQASEKTPIDQAAAEHALKKLGMGSGILHTLWLVILTLMFYRF
jgi:hypothetical protein